MPIMTGSSPKAMSGGRKPGRPKRQKEAKPPKLPKVGQRRSGGRHKSGQPETTLEKLLKGKV